MRRTELLLLNQIVSDVGLMCSVSLDRDSKYIESRVEKEGFEFITLTLPTFAKGIERCLALGFFEPSLFRAFKKTRKDRGLIPAFLQGITSKIFDTDGSLRTNVSIEAIDGVRQICLAFNKTKMECTNARKAKAIEAYVKCERDLSHFRIMEWPGLRDFDRIARIAFGNVFCEVDRQVNDVELLPKHGPGAVTDRLVGNAKWRSLAWSARLERIMPADAYLFHNGIEAANSGRGLVFLPSKAEKPVKVIFVPKTQKTPRVIAIEPSYNQYAQQALMRSLVKGIERSKLLRNCIHFSDAKTNGDLARESSVSGKFATLDMSEASDRVHASLVHRLIRDYPSLTKAVFSCRSKCARLPDKRTLRLRKFASMGSALCFPFEAMVFYALALMGLHDFYGLSISTRSVAKLSKLLHVFGDDLIFPTEAYRPVIERLESARFKVNLSKTFYSGKFRESCGVDAYMGHIVTPVYIRTELPKTRQDAESVSSLVATRNLFYRKGYWRTARFIEENILDRIGPFPHVLETSALLGYTSFLGSYCVERYDSVGQRFVTRGLTLKDKSMADELSEGRRLLKFFLTRSEDPVEVESFERSTRRGSVYTKIRWTTAY